MLPRIIGFIGLLSASAALAQPLRPVPASAVRVEDTFWSARQKAGREGTLRQNIEQCEKTGRISNLEIAAGLKKGEYQGYFFNDSDVFKAIEGACDILEQTKDKGLEAKIDSWINIIAAAQRPDGYLNSYYTVKEGLDKRFSNLRDMHEMYCAGHLIEAGVAHHRVTGKRTLLDVAIKYANLLEETFGPSVLGKSARVPGVCGHEEIELALVKLTDATGEKKYLDLAAYFVEQRGRVEQLGGGGKRELGGEDQQDHKPVREHDQIVGHAVRAMYLYCAVADLAMRNNDQAYLNTLDRVWTDLTETKMYITGGIGNSSHNEGFTTQYDLPNDTAYAETCAAIGNVLWNHRLALLRGADGAKHADVMERALYNGVLSGVSLDGSRFFYTNPLASRGKHQRQEWHACACCPPNILRLVASVGGMAYAQSDSAIYVNLFMGSTADITLKADGKDVPVRVQQATDYPWESMVNLTFTMPEPARFDVYLRLPSWCPGGDLFVNDENAQRIADFSKPGYAKLSREWKPGDRITYHMEMPVLRVRSNQKIKGNVGRVALQRGPMVYCFEEADNEMEGGNVRGVALPVDAPIEAKRESDVLGGVVMLHTTGVRESDGTASAFPTSSLYAPIESTPQPLVAIPYYAWANRTPGDMVVWVPESLALAERPLDPTITATASHCFEGDTLTALYDELEPSSSGDHSVPRFTWWPKQGTTQWVQYEFAKPRDVSAVSVYWFDDSNRGGGCRLPVSWKLFYTEPGAVKGTAGEKSAAVWKEVPGVSELGVKGDAFNRVTFPSLRVGGLRIEAVLQGKTEKDADGYSGGILEWRLK